LLGPMGTLDLVSVSGDAGLSMSHYDGTPIDGFLRHRGQRPGELCGTLSNGPGTYDRRVQVDP
jgi:hypothetical protein